MNHFSSEAKKRCDARWVKNFESPAAEALAFLNSQVVWNACNPPFFTTRGIKKTGVPRDESERSNFCCHISTRVNVNPQKLQSELFCCDSLLLLRHPRMLPTVGIFVLLCYFSMSSQPFPHIFLERACNCGARTLKSGIEVSEHLTNRGSSGTGILPPKAHPQPPPQSAQ